MNILNIIMQGGVFGSIMCTISMDKLAKHANSTKELLYIYKGVAAVPPLLMVDNILTLTKCSSTSRAMNSTVNAFIEIQKLRISHVKCSVINEGKKKVNCPELNTHLKSMYCEEKNYMLEIFFIVMESQNQTCLQEVKKHMP